MPASVWKGFISFGLVSFPVQLFSAARAETVRFHLLHGMDRSRVRQVWYCVEEDKPVERSEMVKGFETGKDEYVVVEDAELKKIAPPTATTMDILQFVATGEVDPIYFERSYYVAPDSKAAKPYSLFLAALAETQQDAIAKIAMHNREHVVLIRPSGGAEKEKLQALDEDLKAELDKNLASVEDEAKKGEIRKLFEERKDQIASMIRDRKTVDFLRTSAKITDEK